MYFSTSINMPRPCLPIIRLSTAQMRTPTSNAPTTIHEPVRLLGAFVEFSCATGVFAALLFSRVVTNAPSVAVGDRSGRGCLFTKVSLTKDVWRTRTPRLESNPSFMFR